MLTKIKNIFSWIVKARSNHQARRDIDRLSERDLRDIGMTRSDLLFTLKH